MSAAVLSAVLAVAAAAALGMAAVGRRRRIKTGRTLVIGGTSGLGRAFGELLHARGDRVTISSRNMGSAVRVSKEIEALHPGRGSVDVLVIDITKDDPFSGVAIEFDCIICTPGMSIPKYFRDQSLAEVERQIQLNYVSVVKCLMYCRQNNPKPFTFVVVGSTCSFLSFPGYSSYAPTKAALLSFVAGSAPELAREGVDLRIYMCTTMNTPGLVRENETKPAFTREVEGGPCAPALEPLEAAERFFRCAGDRRVVSSDWLTYLFAIRAECECLVDYLLFPLAVAVVAAVRACIGRKFRRSEMELCRDETLVTVDAAESAK